MKKAVSILLAVLTVLSVLAVSVSAFSLLERTEYYGRYTLSQMERAEDYLYAYDAIVLGVSQYSALIAVSTNKHSVTPDELGMIYAAYVNDFPQHFWHTFYYQYSLKGDIATFIAPVYCISYSDLPEMVDKFEKAADKFLVGINDGMTEYEKELYIHDKLAEKVVYDMEAENIHNAYGALVNGRAVCDGYAGAFQYLLYKCGIQAHMVIGSVVDDEGNETGHAWNLVRIENKYYYTDVTWDDDESRTLYGFFNATDTVMENNYNQGSFGYPFPVCDSLDANYYYRNGLYFKSLNVATISALLKNSPNYTIDVMIELPVDTVVSWLSTNMSKIASKLGIKKYQVGYMYNGSGEYIIQFVNLDPVEVTLAGDADGNGSVDENDAIAIARSLAGWNVDIDPVYSDVNADGTIDEFDSILLDRFLASWNVKLKIPEK